jgi:PKD repeat protein
MKKHMMGVVGIVLFLILLFFSGCTEQTATKENTEEPILSDNKPPIIQECRVEYFDTSSSSTVYFVGVAFDDDGTVVLYSWNLSDGFRTSEQSFIHTFQNPGSYLAQLTVMDDEGALNSTSIVVYVYESVYENQQRDEERIIGLWENTQGNTIEFTSDGAYIHERIWIRDRYWFGGGSLYIHFAATNQTVEYAYSFQGDNTLMFFLVGQPPTSLDRWVREQ